MRPLPIEPLHRACARYGPGRLPGADRSDVGAGYAPASAALIATLLFATAAVLGETVGLLSSNDGVVWRLLPPEVPFFGPVAGLLGTLGTYVGSLLAVTVILTASAVLGLSGADPVSAAAFSFGVVVLGFTITWWVTLPVGAVSGVVYTAIVEASE